MNTSLVADLLHERLRAPCHVRVHEQYPQLGDALQPRHLLARHELDDPAVRAHRVVHARGRAVQDFLGEVGQLAHGRAVLRRFRLLSSLQLRLTVHEQVNIMYPGLRVQPMSIAINEHI